MNREDDPLFGWAYKQKGDPTIKDVRRAYALLESEFGQGEAHLALSRFGCADPKNLWVGSYRNFIEFAARCVEYRHPPGGGWTDGLPNHLAMMV